MRTQEMILTDVWTDWLTTGVFQKISDYDVPWSDEIDAELLDMEYYGNRSGTKKIAPLIYYLLDENGITSDNKEKLAELCWKKFRKNWTALWNTLNFVYDPISNYDMLETEGTTAGSTTDANSGIYGFNSQQASPSDTSHSTTNGNENRTLTRKGNIGVTTSQQMIQSERDLWMWKFYEQLFADVDTVLVTAVFGCSNRDYLTVIAQAGYKLPIASENTLGGVKAILKTEDMTMEVGIDENGKLWVREPEVDYPVNSVNGKTGAVVLTSDDVGAPTLEEFQQIEDDSEEHTTAINQLWQKTEDLSQDIDGVGAKVPFSFSIDGEGNYGYLKADGSFNPFSSGGGGLPDNLAVGTIDFVYQSGDQHLIDISEIGFKPRSFYLFRLDAPKTNKYVYMTSISAVDVNSAYACFTAYWDYPGTAKAVSSVIGVSSGSFVQKTNGFLYMSNTEIRYVASTYYMYNGKYMWVASSK